MKRLLIGLLAFTLTSAVLASEPGAAAPEHLETSSSPSSVQIGSSGFRVVQVQYALRANSYTIAVDGQFGPQTQKAVIHWQRANGLLADGIVGPKTSASLRLDVIVPAGPPAGPAAPSGGLAGKGFAPAGLSGCDEMNWYRAQWGLPSQFASLGYRESRCRNDVVSNTGCCGGYWQLYVSLFLRDGSMRGRLAACDVDSPGDVIGNDPYDKQRNACVTRALYDVRGLSPWSL